MLSPLHTCRRCYLVFELSADNQCAVCDGPLCPGCSACPMQCWSPQKRKRIRASLVHCYAANLKPSSGD